MRHHLAPLVIVAAMFSGGLVAVGPVTILTLEYVRKSNLNCADYPRENVWRDSECGDFPYGDWTTDRVVKHENDYPYSDGFAPEGGAWKIRTGPGLNDWHVQPFKN